MAIGMPGICGGGIPEGKKEAMGVSGICGVAYRRAKKRQWVCREFVGVAYRKAKKGDKYAENASRNVISWLFQ